MRNETGKFWTIILSTICWWSFVISLGRSFAVSLARIFEGNLRGRHFVPEGPSKGQRIHFVTPDGNGLVHIMCLQPLRLVNGQIDCGQWSVGWFCGDRVQFQGSKKVYGKANGLWQISSVQTCGKKQTNMPVPNGFTIHFCWLNRSCMTNHFKSCCFFVSIWAHPLAPAGRSVAVCWWPTRWSPTFLHCTSHLVKPMPLHVLHVRRSVVTLGRLKHKEGRKLLRTRTEFGRDMPISCPLTICSSTIGMNQSPTAPQIRSESEFKFFHCIHQIILRSVPYIACTESHHVLTSLLVYRL